LHTEHLINVLL